MIEITGIISGTISVLTGICIGIIVEEWSKIKRALKRMEELAKEGEASNDCN